LWGENKKKSERWSRERGNRETVQSLGKRKKKGEDVHQVEDDQQGSQKQWRVVKKKKAMRVI